MRWWPVSPQPTCGCGPGGDDRHLVAEPEAVDQPAALGLGPSQPGRRDVGGVHARRVVDDQDEPPGLADLPAEDRLGQGEDQQEQERELDQEREQVPELLPDRPRLLLLEDLPPEQGGRDRDAAQPDLQDVEDTIGIARPSPGQGERVEQVHRRGLMRAVTHRPGGPHHLEDQLVERDLGRGPRAAQAVGVAVGLDRLLEPVEDLRGTGGGSAR